MKSYEMGSGKGRRTFRILNGNPGQNFVELNNSIEKLQIFHWKCLKFTKWQKIFFTYDQTATLFKMIFLWN